MNEEFEHDQTPAELKHPPRVSFHSVVKAVDIVQDPEEHDNEDGAIQAMASPVTEESTTATTSPRSDTGSHEYTVPLNDTQPKEGLTLLQQIKALQFHNMNLTADRWAAAADDQNNEHSTNHEGIVKKKRLI